jgi:cell division control protein 6
VVLSVYHLNRADVHRAITGEIYEVYNELCGEIGVAPLTQRRLSSLISELDSMGLLNAKVISMGRYGRTKKIRLEIARVLIKDVFGDDNRLGRFIDYEPKCLSRNPNSGR